MVVETYSFLPRRRRIVLCLNELASLLRVCCNSIILLEWKSEMQSVDVFTIKVRFISSAIFHNFGFEFFIGSYFLVQDIIIPII